MLPRATGRIGILSEFTDINMAILIEKQIKGWSEAKKEVAIEGRFEDLPSLAKKKFKK